MNLIDKRNEEILVHINGKLVPRNEAKISVFDSAVQGGRCCLGRIKNI